MRDGWRNVWQLLAEGACIVKSQKLGGGRVVFLGIR